MSIKDSLRESSKIAQILKATFSTSDGQTTLSYLEDLYENVNLFSSDSLEMARRIGAQEVIREIKYLIKLAEGE